MISSILMQMKTTGVNDIMLDFDSDPDTILL